MAGLVRTADRLRVVKRLGLALLAGALALMPAFYAGVTAQDQQVDPGLSAVTAPAPFTFSTLDRVRQRGYVICGATQLTAGFAQADAEGRWYGFDVDICRAVATAVFGDDTRIDFRPLSGNSRFAHLQQGDVDLLSRNASWTMSRDTQFDVTYVATSFFDGQAFMVSGAHHVVSAYELRGVTLCLPSDPDSIRRVNDFFGADISRFETLVFEDREDLAVAYRNGRCGAISGQAGWLQAMRRTLVDPAQHAILPERLSKLPYGPVVRDDDPEWQTIVRWALYAMINAEELGVTSQNIDSLTSARTRAIRQLLGNGEDLGTPLGLSPNFMRDVVRSVGNYGEVYDRHFGSGSAAPLLRGQNGLWTTGGLLFAPPFV